MGDAEFRDELRNVLDRHSADLDPEDLRSIADNLESLADRWEDNEVVI